MLTSRKGYSRSTQPTQSLDCHLDPIINFFDKEHTITKDIHTTQTGYQNYNPPPNKMQPPKPLSKEELSSICNKCQEDETTVHYLARCPAFILYRKHYIGNFIILQKGSLTLRITPTNLLAFAKATKYLNFYEPP